MRQVLECRANQVVVRLGHYKGSAAGDKSFKKSLVILMEAVPRRN